jgi:hypothetical protein
MRKYILPSLLILALGAGLAVAQTISKAIQLSQDATGVFGVDTGNNVYFSNHVLNTSQGQTLATVAGTGSPSITGTDVAGTITMGTSATTATVTFGRAYLSVPNCVASWLSGNATSSPTAYTPATTSIAFTQTATSANKVSYFCTGFN